MAGNWVTELFDEPETLVGEVVVGDPLAAVPKSRALSKKERKKQELEAITDEIFEESLEVMEGALRFTQLDAKNLAMPPGWVETMGPERAERMYRAAQYALMDKKNAPVGLDIAAKMAIGIIKARSVDKGGPRNLNVALVQINVPKMAKYEEQDETETR